MTQTLEVAEDDRGAVPLGKPAHLLVQRRQHLAPIIRGLRRRRLGRETGGPGPGPFGAAARLGRDPASHAVEPPPQGIIDPDRASPAHEHQERGLERVFDFGGIRQSTPADPQDHRPVAGHQGLERRLGRAGRVGRFGRPGPEPLQQLGVGQTGDHPRAEQGADRAQQVGRPRAGHRHPSRQNLIVISLYHPGSRPFHTRFFRDRLDSAGTDGLASAAGSIGLRAHASASSTIAAIPTADTTSPTRNDRGS